MKKLFIHLFLIFAFLLGLIILSEFTAHAADVTLAWDANTEEDLAGYILFYGNTSRTESGFTAYDNAIDVKNITQYALTDLPDGEYFFALKAYDTGANVSEYSDELGPVNLPLDGVAPSKPGMPKNYREIKINNGNGSILIIILP